jgi:NAD(P)H-dependent FMN reductase
VGGYVAISDRLGAVSTMRTLRDKFYESSVACVKHVMPSNTDAHGTASKLMSSKEDLAELILVPRQKNQLKNNKKDQHAGASSLRSKSMNNLLTSAASEQLAAQSNLKPLPVNGRLEVTPAASRLEDKPSPTAGGISQQGGTEKRALDDVRQHIDNVDAKLKKKHAYDEGWTIYARIWNEIILQLRLRDYLDNKQQEVFQVTEFTWLQSPIYLPLFYTAGTVDTAIFECENFVQSTKGLNQRARSDQYEEFSAKAFDFPTREACRQSVELTHWVLSTLIGPSVALVLTSLVDELSTLASSSVGDLFNCFNIDKLKIIKGIVSSIAKTLLTEAKGSRKSKPVVTAAKKEEYKAHGVELALRTQDINTTKPTLKGFKKSQSTGNLQGLIVSLDANQVARQLSAEDQPKVFTKDYLLADPARDKVRDDIKKLFKEVLGAYHAADDNIKLHLRPNSEFFTDDFVASELIDKFCALKEALPVVQMLEGILLLPQTSVSCRV